MTENNSRQERKKARKNSKSENTKGLSKIYYWIIGILFLVLLLLVVYIFVKSGSSTDLGENSETKVLVQEETAENKNDENQTDSEATEEETETDQENSEEDSEDLEKTEEPEEQEEQEEQATVNDDAPYNPNHAVDFSDGSADRLAIKEKIIQLTDLESDLTEHWVGNDGPGRVTAVAYNPDQSKIYRVFLQYGDGEWHATNYERLNSIPDD